MEKDILIVDHISLVKESIGYENRQYDLIMKLGKRLRVRKIRKEKIRKLCQI